MVEGVSKMLSSASTLDEEDLVEQEKRPGHKGQAHGHRHAPRIAQPQEQEERHGQRRDGKPQRLGQDNIENDAADDLGHSSSAGAGDAEPLFALLGPWIEQEQ